MQMRFSIEVERFEEYQHIEVFWGLWWVYRCNSDLPVYEFNVVGLHPFFLSSLSRAMLAVVSCKIA